MNTQEALNAIHKAGIIPVASAAQAILAAEAMEEGGIPVVEITMTVPGAIEAIRKVRAEFGNRVLVGAGDGRSPSAKPKSVSTTFGFG